MKYYLTFFALLLAVTSCNESSISNKKRQRTGEIVETELENKEIDRQLNISILWDLSDRIDPNKNPASPEHYERDIEAIKASILFFKRDMEKRGAFKAKGKIKIFFTPTPIDNRINSIARNMSCDLSAFTGEGANKKKKELYDSLEGRFSRCAEEIYQITLSNNKGNRKWDGSDIWRFFKNDVKEYCVASSDNYRNILIILTDGYIFHKDSRNKQGNRTSYILPEILKPLRNNSRWRDIFYKGDYGLLAPRNDLQDLEVLVLEIKPSNEHKNDEDIIKAYLGKWFEEMGVVRSNYACFNTDLPEYTKNKIIKFLNR